MPLYRPRYYVEYDPAQPPTEVVVSSGDMMRAELEAKRLRLADGLPFHTTALWLWSALVRLGIEQRPAGEFITDPPEWQPVTNAAGKPVQAEVDPTQPESGETDSGAPLSLVNHPSGSTPT